MAPDGYELRYFEIYENLRLIASVYEVLIRFTVKKN